MQTTDQPSFSSPCIRQCCLDTHDICVGCYRSLDEILAWTESNDNGKQRILDNAEIRKLNFTQRRK